MTTWRTGRPKPLSSTHARDNPFNRHIANAARLSPSAVCSALAEHLVTGVSEVAGEFLAKRLELLNESLPSLRNRRQHLWWLRTQSLGLGLRMWDG